jgi:hypothetical protein
MHETSDHLEVPALVHLDETHFIFDKFSCKNFKITHILHKQQTMQFDEQILYIILEPC